MVHEHQRRRVRRRRELRGQPGRARVAKRPAVATRLHRVEQQHAQVIAFDRVVQEIAVELDLRKRRHQRVAGVVVADHRPHRERHLGQ
jgi:hypothetical protein